MLGIIGAMDVEVAEVKEAMQDVEVKTMAGMDFYKGILRGKEAVVVRSGIGKVNREFDTPLIKKTPLSRYRLIFFCQIL